MQDENGFPLNTNYFKFAFLNLPHPKKVDPYELFRQHISKSYFPVQSSSDGTGYTVTGGRIPLVNEIVGATHHLEWTKDEANSLFEKLLNWWDKDKKNLIGENNTSSFFGGSRSDEFKARFSRLKSVLSETILPYFVKNTPSEKKVKEVNRLVRELTEHGLISIELKIVGFPLLDYTEERLIQDIENMLNSDSRDEATAGQNAIYFLIKYHSYFKKYSINRLLVVLAQKIYWYHQVGIENSLFRVNDIVKTSPEYYKGDFEKSCLKVLNSLAMHTNLTDGLYEVEYHKRLEVREKSAEFAFTLFRYYERKEVPIPKEVMSWKEICEDPEEFGEVRAKWDSCVPFS